MKDALIVTALSMVPRKWTARRMGWFARTGLSRLTTRMFVSAYGVDLSEAEGELDDYPTLEALFTRRLVEGARPIDPADGILVSPVDGTVAAVGPTQQGCIDVAPGRALHIPTLLGGPDLKDERDVAVLYLSPTDYHRVHTPTEGELSRWRYLPGRLWPVMPAAVQRVDALFERNERAVVWLQTTQGLVEVVLVGAFGVGRMSLVCCDLLTNTGGAATSAILSPPQQVARGGDLGVFHLGSTVVVCTPPGRWRWSVEAGTAIRVGERLAETVETTDVENG